MNDKATKPEEGQTILTAPSTTTISTTSSGSKRATSAAEYTPARRKVVNVINKRVAKVLNALHVLGNVSKLSVIDQQLSDGDVERIMTSVEAEVAFLRRRLTSAATGKQLDHEFDLEAKAE